MAWLSDVPVTTESLPEDFKDYLAESIPSLQRARLDTLKNATLEDLFKGRNPYLLRGIGQEAYQLMSRILDYYLASTDEAHFEKFSRDLSTFLKRSTSQQVEPADIIEHFVPKRLPLRIELLTAYDHTYNRLTRQFYVELCGEDTQIDWGRLTRFISQCGAQDCPRDIVDKTEEQ